LQQTGANRRSDRFENQGLSVMARGRRRINFRPNTGVSPNKTGIAPAAHASSPVAKRELDACSRAIYGYSHVEFCDKLFEYAFALGKREGRTAGRRAAKGLKTPAKKRGRPPEIDEGERSLLIYEVEQRKPGQTIRAAVTRFLHLMQVGERGLADPNSSYSPYTPPPREAEIKKALWAYYRHSPRKGQS
jgi:hypothetical protein